MFYNYKKIEKGDILPEFASVIISGNKICKFQFEENEFLLLTKFDPNCSKYDKHIKNNYGLLCIHKEKHENIWLITVQTCKEVYSIKWVSFDTFLKQNSKNLSIKPVYDYILEKQKSLSIKLQYGLRNGKIISIWDLTEEDRGLKCNCICPGCGMQLQAKLGSGKKQRHFSHNNANCNIAIAQQTALHMLAKEIIEQEKTVKFPPIIIPFEQTNLYKFDPNYLRQFSYRYLSNLPTEMEYKPATIVDFDSVVLEKKVSSIIPDIIAFKGNKACLIEIAVTHFIDENKEKKIQELKLPVLEIDISSLSTENLNRDILKSVLTNQIENKKWVYNPLWENAILWADNQYEIEIEKIKKEIRKDELLQQERQIREQKRREQKLKRREAGMDALENVLIPENYSAMIEKLRDDESYNILYKNSWFYKESKNPPFFLDIPICGEFIFNCDRRIWQTLIFYKFVYNRKEDDFGQIYISFNKISEWIKKYQKDFSINWEFSYKIELNDKVYNLLRDVVLDYLFYLRELGFIEYEFSAFGGSGSVVEPRKLMPPNKEYATKLKIAIDSVNGASPDVNEQIYSCIKNLYNANI